MCLVLSFGNVPVGVWTCGLGNVLGSLGFDKGRDMKFFHFSLLHNGYIGPGASLLFGGYCELFREDIAARA